MPSSKPSFPATPAPECRHQLHRSRQGLKKGILLQLLSGGGTDQRHDRDGPREEKEEEEEELLWPLVLEEDDDNVDDDDQFRETSSTSMSEKGEGKGREVSKGTRTAAAAAAATATATATELEKEKEEASFYEPEIVTENCQQEADEGTSARPAKRERGQQTSSSWGHEASSVVTTQPAQTKKKSALKSARRQRWERDEEERTVLCYSPKKPKPGQVDLFPRSWCSCLNHEGETGQSRFYGDDDDAKVSPWRRRRQQQHFRKSKEGSLSDSEAAAAATLHPSGAEAACDLAWRICFYLVCFPLCYPCYVSRTVRKRTKSKHRTLEDELVRSSSSSSLVDMFNKASDEMNRTMLRQVSQAKIKEKQSTETGDKEQKQDAGGANEEEGGDDSKVISVNVVLLHSASSPLLHETLSTRLPSCATVATGSMISLQSDQSGLLMTREPKAQEEEQEEGDVADGGEKLQEVGASSSRFDVFLTVPEQPWTREMMSGRQQQRRKLTSGSPEHHDHQHYQHHHNYHHHPPPPPPQRRGSRLRGSQELSPVREDVAFPDGLENGVEKAAEPSVDEHGITIEDEEGEKGGDGDSGKRLAALLEPEKGKEEDDKKDEEEAEKEEEVALGHGLFGLGLVGRGGLKERRMKTRRNNAVAAAVAVVDTNVVTAEKRKRSIVTVLPATDEQEEETVEQDRNKSLVPPPPALTVIESSPPPVEFADCTSEISGVKDGNNGYDDDEDNNDDNDEAFELARSTPEEGESPPPSPSPSPSPSPLPTTPSVRLRREEGEEKKSNSFGDWIGRRISFRGRVGPADAHGGGEANLKAKEEQEENSTSSSSVAPTGEGVGGGGLLRRLSVLRRGGRRSRPSSSVGIDGGGSGDSVNVQGRRRSNNLFGSSEAVPASASDSKFYSFESEEEEEDDDTPWDEQSFWDDFGTRRRGGRRRPQIRSWGGRRKGRLLFASRGERVVQMESLGKRIEMIKDLGYQMSFSVFDEASVSEWKGVDLRLANEIPNMDLVVLAVKRNHLTELNAVLASTSGMMHFLGRFWRGFYPLLLVELYNQESILEEIPEFASKLSRLDSVFGSVHHIRVAETQLADSVEWITECLARLYIHTRLYQCQRFYGHGLDALDQCPGGCGLSKTRKRTSRRMERKRVKWKRKQSVYVRSKMVSS